MDKVYNAFESGGFLLHQGKYTGLHYKANRNVLTVSKGYDSEDASFEITLEENSITMPVDTLIPAHALFMCALLAKRFATEKNSPKKIACAWNQSIDGYCIKSCTFFSFNEASPGLLVAVHRPGSINDTITYVSLEEKRIAKSYDISGRISFLVNIIDNSNKEEIKDLPKEYQLWPHIIGVVINNVFTIGHIHTDIQEEFFQQRQNPFHDTCVAESLRQVIYAPHCYTIVLALQNQVILCNLKTCQKQTKCFDGNIEAVEYQKLDKFVFLWAIVSENNQLVGHLGLLSKSGKETVKEFQFTHQLNFLTDFKKFISLKTFGERQNVFVESDFACFMFFNQSNETCVSLFHFDLFLKEFRHSNHPKMIHEFQNIKKFFTFFNEKIDDFNDKEILDIQIYKNECAITVEGELKSDAISHSTSIKLLVNDSVRNLNVDSEILKYLKLVQDNLFNYLLQPEVVCKKLVEYGIIPKGFKRNPSIKPILSSLFCNNLFDGIKQFVPCASFDQLDILLDWIRIEMNMNAQNSTKLELICKQKRRLHKELSKAQKIRNEMKASEGISVTKDRSRKRCRSAPENLLNITDKRLKLDNQRLINDSNNFDTSNLNDDPVMPSGVNGIQQSDIDYTFDPHERFDESDIQSSEEDNSTNDCQLQNPFVSNLAGMNLLAENEASIGEDVDIDIPQEHTENSTDERPEEIALLSDDIAAEGYGEEGNPSGNGQDLTEDTEEIHPNESSTDEIAIADPSHSTSRQADIIHSSNYRIFIEYFGGKPIPHLYIFDSTDPTLCYNYSYLKREKVFVCRNCRTKKTTHVPVAKIITNENDEECVRLFGSKHKCKPEKPKTVIHKPNFETVQGGPKNAQHLHVFYSKDKTKYYDYTWTQNTYRCIPCQKLKIHATARLATDENGKEVCILNAKKHQCKPRKLCPEKPSARRKKRN